MKHSSSRYPSLWGSAGYAMLQAGLSWRANLEVALAPLGLTPTQWTLLLALCSLLDETQHTPTQRDLAAFAGVDRAMVSQALKAMERRGLVTRQFEGDNLRSKYIRVTEKGEQLVQQGIATFTEVNTRFFGSFIQQYPRLPNELRELVISNRLETATSDAEDC